MEKLTDNMFPMTSAASLTPDSVRLMDEGRVLKPSSMLMASMLRVPMSSQFMLCGEEEVTRAFETHSAK